MKTMRWVGAALLAAVIVPPGYASGATDGAKASLTWDQRLLLIDFPVSMRTWSNDLRSDAVRMTPHLPTRCRWESDTRLACEFTDATPALATRYSIAIAGALRRADGAEARVGPMTLDTARPTVTARIEDWTRGRPNVRITASEGVDRAGLARVLRLRLDGVDAALPRIEPATTGYAAERNFVLVLPELTGADRHVELALVPGLVSANGPLRGTDDKVLVRALAQEAPVLRGASCDGARGRVRWTPAAPAELRCRGGVPVQLRMTRAPDAASLEWDPLESTCRHASLSIL